MGRYRPWLVPLIVGFAPGCLGTTTSPSASCVSCHGSATSAAPPEALGGATDTTHPGVGAHEAHTTPGNFAPIACGECHEVPASVDAPGHVDSPWPAEVRWGPVAKTDAVALPWDREAMTCTTWCHGAGLTGGTNTTPSWVIVDGSQDACGTCHGSPPPDPHPASSDCGECHQGGEGTHADGIVQLAGDTGDTGVLAGCASGCHGDDTSPAPPTDTTGGTETSLRGVGAHRAHLEPANAAPVPCGTCHLVPDAVDDPGHLGDLPADVLFSGRAELAASNPTWDPTSLTCSGSYCHTRWGATNPEPHWTTVDGTEAACGSCHGVPPPPSHPTSTGCSGCHGGVASSTEILDPARHADGTVDF